MTYEAHWREQLRPIFEKWDRGLWPGYTLSGAVAYELAHAGLIERVPDGPYEGNWRITEGGVAYLFGEPWGASTEERR